MNKFILDIDGGFLVVETKFGIVQIEQFEFFTSVKIVENLFQNRSHIEDHSYGETKIISLVSDNAPDER